MRRRISSPNQVVEREEPERPAEGDLRVLRRVAAGRAGLRVRGRRSQPRQLDR